MRELAAGARELAHRAEATCQVLEARGSGALEEMARGQARRRREAAVAAAGRALQVLQQVCVGETGV